MKKTPHIAYPPNFVQPPTPIPRSFCCLVSLAGRVIMPDLMCHFTWWYYGSKLWYLSTSNTLLCILCNKALNLLKIWHGWHGFCWYSDLNTHTQTTHTGYTRINRLTHIQIYINNTCYVHTTTTCITMNNLLMQKLALQRSTMSLLFKKCSLKPYTCWLDSKRLCPSVKLK